jgi:hypothetical protein
MILGLIDAYSGFGGPQSMLRVLLRASQQKREEGFPSWRVHPFICLSLCLQLDVEDEEDIKSGFKITFSFSPDNPFFSEQKLVKVGCMHLVLPA